MSQKRPLMWEKGGRTGIHPEDAAERILGVLETAVPVVQDADSVPELGLLGIRQVIECLLVGRVCLLEIVHHQVAVTWKDENNVERAASVQWFVERVEDCRRRTEGSPNLSVVLRDVEHSLEELDGLVCNIGRKKDKRSAVCKGSRKQRRETDLSKVILRSSDARNLGERADASRVVAKGVLVRRLCSVEVRQLLGNGSC